MNFIKINHCINFWAWCYWKCLDLNGNKFYRVCGIEFTKRR